MALDSCHQQVVNALEKAGWNVEKSAYVIELDRIRVFPDIRARQINGQVDEILVVEVKCFPHEENYQDELYRAIGQYLIYRTIMEMKAVPAKIYMAIPVFVYNRLFQRQVVAKTIQETKIRLIVVDIDREEIVQWLD
ncbi:MAG: element excision factor XisH family protein [Chloroflexota bacterium]